MATICQICKVQYTESIGKHCLSWESLEGHFPQGAWMNEWNWATIFPFSGLVEIIGFLKIWHFSSPKRKAFVLQRCLCNRAHWTVVAWWWKSSLMIVPFHFPENSSSCFLTVLTQCFFRIFNFPYVAKILFIKLLYFWQDFAPFALTLVGIERGANCADGTTTGNAKSVYQTRVSSLKRVHFFKQFQEGKEIEIAALKKNVFCFEKISSPNAKTVFKFKPRSKKEKKESQVSH